MKDQENRGKLFFWKKGPVAKTILYSYLIVLLLPLILTVLMTTTAVLQLQKENARHVESTSTELSRVFSAYVEEIQSTNTRLLISENTRQLSLVNPDSFSTSPPPISCSCGICRSSFPKPPSLPNISRPSISVFSAAAP